MSAKTEFASNERKNHYFFANIQKSIFFNAMYDSVNEDVLSFDAIISRFRGIGDHKKKITSITLQNCAI